MPATLSERAGAERALPVLNDDTFKQTAAYLTQDVVATYMRTIADRCEHLLGALRETARPDAGLAESAHALAGSAGLFGFERVAAAGRLLERSILTNADDVAALAAEFASALEATLHAIGKHTMGAAA